MRIRCITSFLLWRLSVSIGSYLSKSVFPSLTMNDPSPGGQMGALKPYRPQYAFPPFMFDMSLAELGAPATHGSNNTESGQMIAGLRPFASASAWRKNDPT